MADFDVFLKELSKIEKSLPDSLQEAVVSLKHGLGALSIETTIFLNGFIKEFMDVMDDGCKYCHHTVDANFGFYDVFIDDGEGKKQSWRVGTHQMFCDFLTHEYETDDEKLGYLSTMFIIGFLSVQSPDIKSILDSDYNNPNVEH